MGTFHFIGEQSRRIYPSVLVQRVPGLLAYESSDLFQPSQRLGLDGPTTIHGDDMGAIALAKNPIDHKRTRHINISYHFVRELIINGTIAFNYISTNEMVADGLTKALTPAKFGDFVDMLGLADAGPEDQ